MVPLYTNQAGDPILGKAMGKNYEPESSKSDGEDKEKEKNTGGNGNKGEDTNQANPQVFNNANGGKETKEMSQYKENTIERPVTQPLGEKRDSATFRPAPSGFVGHKTGDSSASSVNNVFNNVNQYATSITDAKNSSSTYNMQGGNGKK